MEFCIFVKVNNSLATKVCANLLNKRKTNLIVSELHNSMTKLCSTLFKCEKKLEIG